MITKAGKSSSDFYRGIYRVIAVLLSIQSLMTVALPAWVAFVTIFAVMTFVIELDADATWCVVCCFVGGRAVSLVGADGGCKI